MSRLPLMTDKDAPLNEAPMASDPDERERFRLVGLDGLRGVAVSLLVVHHAANVAGAERSSPFDVVASVADVGISVLFVATGLVIYQPFARAHATGGASPAAVPFWWRRALRILPAYWFALFGLWALGLISFDSPATALSHASLTHVVSPSLAFSGISQSWALSVTVSFYAIVPLVSWALRRRGPVTARMEWGVVGALFMAGYAARAVVSLGEVGWGDSTLRGMSFLWLPTNIDLFALGMAIAVFHARCFVGDSVSEKLGPRMAEVARRARRSTLSAGPWWLAGAALLVAYAYVAGPADFDVGYRGWFWERRQFAFGLIGFALVFPLSWRGGRGPTRAVLGSTPGLWFGAFSYGLFLWHNGWIARLGTELSNPTPGLPEFLGTGPGDVWFPATLAVGFGLGMLCGAIGWFVVEQPAQRFRSLPRSLLGRTRS